MIMSQSSYYPVTKSVCFYFVFRNNKFVNVYFLYCQMSDWDRYAAEEYELLVAEEGGNDNQEEM